MRRLVALAGLTVPLLAISPAAFASTGSALGGTTTGTSAPSTLTAPASSTTSTAGALSTSAVTGTLSTPTTSSGATSGTTAVSSTLSSVSSTVSAASTAVNTAVAAPASTAATSSATPAPPGSAEAFGLSVPGIVALSHTSATANGNPNDSAATANPLELGGSPVVGGSVKGSSGGTKQGTLFGAGDPNSSANPLSPLGLSVMPYDASVVNSANGQKADSSASLLTLLLPDQSQGGPTVFLDLVHSESHATYTKGSPDTSTGATTAYGAHLELGGKSPSDDCTDNSCLSVYLLYSHTSSSGKGNNAYLASVNGNQVANASQVNGQCNIPLNPLIDIICVTASGGTGIPGEQGTQQSSVLTATSQSGLPTPIYGFSGTARPATGTGGGGSQVPGQQTKGGGGSGGSGSGGSGSGGSGSGGGNGSGSGGGSGVAPAAVTSGLTSPAATLPFTGFNAALAALLGAFLTLAGVALRRRVSVR